MIDPRLNLATRFLALTPEKQGSFLKALTQSGRSVQDLPLPALLQPGDTIGISGLGRYFWFLDRFGFGGVCSVACGVRFSGDLDVGAFEVALGLVVARQEALRLRFSEASDGGLTCRAVPPNEAQIVLQQVDLSGFDADVAEARLAALSEQDAGDRIDLLNGPGWRATLVHMPQGQALLLTLHHILCDGWSMGILQSDLLAALAGEAGAPLSPGYLDVQRWQAALAEAGAGQDSLDWWLEVFGNAAPDRLELPTDRSRPAQRSWRGGRIEQEIPADLAARLRALAQARGATLQQVLMAGWVALLHRLTGAQDLCVGLPVAGRSRAEMQAMIGLFVNTLPLPVTVDPREGFSGLVDRVRGQSAEALAHQDVSLEALTAALRGEDADASRPLFDVVHAHQPLMADRITLPDGQEAQGFARSTGAQQFDLALETVESADGPIAAALGYDVDLFGAATPTRWLAAWIDLLAAGVAAPDRALDLIDLRSPAEAAQLPAPWPDSQAQADTLVPAAVAAQDPTRVAIVFDGVETSYGALNAMANQVAHALLARGLTPESRVGVCLPRGAQAIAACLGVMRAGCAFVPLDPTHPEDRRAYILDDSAAALVIADKEAGIDTLFPDDINGPETDPAAELSPDQLAYVIYTSGSTGQPKGVAVEHGPLAMHVATTAAAYEMGADCRELHMLSLAFDGAHERWMVPFWLGGAIVMRPDALWSGAETLQVMADQSVTNAGFPTALLHQVADAARGSEAPPVQMYSFGGEAMPRAGFDLVAQALQPELMINGYGPTECVISPMIWKAQPGSEAAQFDTPNAPIGRPVGARRAYVLDDRLRPVLPGQPGELYLAGGLARGYLGRPGQTARVFLPDPFGTPGSRMYRTGDRVRQRADGVIEYLGRADRQIKLRGYRIEPGEIEARLMACEEVAQAHVARVDQDHGPLLAAWVTPAQGANPDEASLQRRLAADLPAYMVPAQIETLTAFPKTPNGKTDTKALRLTPRAQPASQTDETLTQTEAKIADIWTQILKTKPNKKSNFFKQGGDSIKAIQLVDRLRTEFPDRQLSLADLFNSADLSTLAKRLEQEDRENLAVVHLKEGGEKGKLFLFPGLMVNTREYAPLAHYLERHGHAEHSISGFVCYSLNENRSSETTISGIAETYAEYIRKHAIGADCTFLGWSWGGVLAYETARLLGKDIELSFVGMLDVCDLDVNFATGTLIDITPLQEKALTERVEEWLPRTKLRPKWEALFRKMDSDLFRQFLRYVQTAGGQLPVDGPSIGSREYELWTYLDNTLIYRQHHTQATEIPVHVWRAEDSIKRKLQLVDWSKYTPGVQRVVTVPGVTHRQIVDSPDFHRSFAQSLSGNWAKELTDA